MQIKWKKSGKSVNSSEVTKLWSDVNANYLVAHIALIKLCEEAFGTRHKTLVGLNSHYHASGLLIAEKGLKSLAAYGCGSYVRRITVKHFDRVL